MNDCQNELRKQWIAFWKSHKQAFAKGLKLPPIPDKLFDLRCGAKTRAGSPCKQRTIYSSGRCKFHGGLSTGPKTDEGKKIAAGNYQQRLSRDHEPHEDMLNAHFQKITPSLKIIARKARTTFSQDKGGARLVRCIDCQHMSAGYTCLVGQKFNLPVGEKRECPSFDATEV